VVARPTTGVVLGDERNSNIVSLTDDQVVQTRPQWWTDLDTKAVDTARVLAMDAVQRAGNGHPGTAMSLAPLAYLMFQKVLRHDPSDPNWVGRDRFVPSNGHSSLTLYIQLYFSGYGLELDDLKALRTAAHATLDRVGKISSTTTGT
jgi:transketolase